VRNFDALVVGGGPAGSTTALRLAKGGSSVLLVDKARFPRDKPCGGGMTLRAVKECPVDPSPVVEDEIDDVELRFRYRDFIVRNARTPCVWMTQRRRLDAFLLDAACEAGVEVLEGTKVELGEEQVHTLEGGERVQAAVVVGADGANGTTARAAGLGNNIVHGVAFEGNLPYGGAISRERYGRRLVLELADIPGGYGWVFPKGDHVNIGVGGWDSEGPKLRDHLRRLCEAHGVEVEQLEQLRGHRLPLRRASTKMAKERVLLVGDAAGLIDPVSGDGMFECFVSSRLAAEAIEALLAGRASSLEPYESAVDSALTPLHIASWTLKTALDRFPRATWRVARTELLWRTIEHILIGEMRHPGEQRGLARMPLRALAVLGR
jgi:geranylgeranyl reductase family protein